ncbi:MAG: hypothetical protein JNM70_23270 [Anaerolineae bacterium]|nr:hypothetical protein [Anaerolineae bacterium]
MTSIARLGRFVGIHLILCTQRPDVKVLDGAIKTNMTVRLAGRMPTSSDSVTVLGNSGASDLAAVPGRMMLQLGPDPVPVQTPHLDDQALTDALKEAMSYAAPDFEMPVVARQIIHQRWTVERAIDLIVTHLNGKATWKALYEAGKDDELSQGQARQLVEQIWTMPVIEHHGQKYQIKVGRSNARQLVPIEVSEA